MIPSIPAYDEIHVISDLHMGGEPGFQILRETARLANFIRWVGEQRPDGNVALILNGDVIDTLAEKDNKDYVATDNAVDILKRIMSDNAFAPVWKALADFVKLDKRTLVFVLGNHDIELAFPTVQRAILDELAGDDLTARARVEFSTIGAGYSCLVDGARVYCTHGNEVDAWNFIRYEELSKAARRINTNRPIPKTEWEPNAGTKMVKEVMNDVKRRYAWIDLLKPETGAAVGALAALDPKQLEKLKSIIPIIGKKIVDNSQVDQRLSADSFASPPSPDTKFNLPDDALLGPSLLQGITPQETAKRMKADKMLLDAENNYTDLSLDARQSAETLGAGQLIWDRLTGWLFNVSKEEALRRALQDWLKDDTTFDIANKDKDALFPLIMKSLGSDIDFVITGHTHLERALEIGDNRYYFNCGTWIRLLRITADMLKDEKTFGPVYQVLEKGDMVSIDAAVFEGKPFVLDRSSAVCVKKTGNGNVVGELAHINDDKINPCVVIQQFTRT